MKFSVRLTIRWEINRIKNLCRYLMSSVNDRNKVPGDLIDETTGCILLAHIGSRPIPDYAADCVEQIRLFSDIPVFFICSRKKEVDKRLSDICRMIYIEDVPVSQLHRLFWKRLSSHRVRFDNFFQAALERFFFLYDAMEYFGFKNVIHMENDILIYEDPRLLAERIGKLYDSITVPRMNEKDCMASVMYIPDIRAFKPFLEFVIENIYERGCNDMNLLAKYLRSNGFDSLPVICEQYVNKYGLVNKKGECAPENVKEDYYRHTEELGGIFDAAPIGQFIGGTDIKPGGVLENRGFINQASYTDPSLMDIIWSKTDKGYIPMLGCDDRSYRIYNLHIHCKELYKYRSDTSESDHLKR